VGCGKRPVLVYEFLHLFAVSNPLLALWDSRQHHCVRSAYFLPLLRFLDALFFGLLWDEDILDQLSVFFSFLELAFPISLLVPFLFFLFLLVFLYLLEPHIFLVVWGVVVD
jgi:hypothetical protein